MLIGYILLAYILYLFIKHLIDKVRAHIEDKAIEKYNFTSQLEPYFQWLDRSNHSIEYKNRHSELRIIANETYPGLAGRIERDERREFYERYILPGKRRYKTRRY